MADSERAQLVAFSRRAIQQVRIIAHQLTQERKDAARIFCGQLASELATILHRLDELDEHDLIDSATETRLLKVMAALNRLCQARERNQPRENSLPVIHSCNRTQYPALAYLLQGNDESARIRLLMFATSRLKQKARVLVIRIVKSFDRAYSKPFLKGKLVGRLHGEYKEHYMQGGEGHIRALFHTLAPYCFCQTEESWKEIAAHIRLRRCCIPDKDASSAVFGMFFLDHPHDDNSYGRSRWQEAHIRVLRDTKTRFDDEDSTHGDAKGGSAVSRQSFCGLISRRQSSQLGLEISNNLLYTNSVLFPSQGFCLTDSSVSLAELLKMTRPSQRMRLLLSCILARAFCQLYDTEWMQNDWTGRDIHFMYECRSDTPRAIYVDEPFLSAHLNRVPREPEAEFRIHPVPKLLAFAIILLELELGICIEDYRAAENMGPDGQPNVNADLITAKSLADPNKLWDLRDTLIPVRSVIRFCLEPDILAPHVRDTEKLRYLLAQHILAPLLDHYTRAWGSPEVPIRPTDTNLANPRFGGVYQRMPTRGAAETVATDTSTKRNFHSDMQEHVYKTNNTHKVLSSATWFGQLDDLNFVLNSKASSRDQHYTPVRIAILDTGLHKELAEVVSAYKDFTGGSSNVPQDTTSHGTNAVRLIQMIYEAASIYVGRVFEGCTASKDTVAHMAKAIRYAKDIWKVDIIILPSGFKMHYDEIHAAVDDANAARILVFAAASNYGNLTEIAFPARLYRHRKVMCMFATDAANRVSPVFNPSPLPEPKYSFAIFGDNIELPEVDKPLSGTSYSAIIGGAIAGLILDFSRQKDIRSAIPYSERLKTFEGMQAVFIEMADGVVDNTYHCMAPWKLLPPQVFGDNDQSDFRSQARLYISQTISRALQILY